MINRNKYDSIIEELQEVSSHHQGSDFEKSLKCLTNIRDEFDIKLMVVGHFSAGKSSLLNVLMNRPEFLKEAQEPQTAIATELIYDDNESIFAYDLNGNKEFFDIEKEYTPNKYDHLEYRLNASVLKEIGDFTIVDTPGFDAGIEAHTKALANYIGVGSAYLVIIDQEKGGIDKTTLEFIQEISHYSNQIAVLINKCDKIPKAVADNIAESARLTLAIHGLPYKVYTVSKRNVDISSELVSIIKSFDAQLAFDKMMMRQILSEAVNIEKILSITKKKMFLDTFDLDTDIASYKRIEEQLSSTFEKKRVEAAENLDNQVQETIHQIRSTLISRADLVADALVSGNQVAAEAIIVETIRPIMLTSVKDISVKQIDNLSNALDFTGLVNKSEASDLTEVAINLANNLKELIEQDSFVSKTPADITEFEKKKISYRAIMGITAIATDVIAPWLEVVIILLPDIVNLLRGIFGESDTELAKRRFINNVIPQIINKLYPQIKENVDITTKLVLEEYEKLLTEKIGVIKNNMIKAQNIKKQKSEEFEKYKKVLSDDISILKNLVSELG